MPTTTPDSIYYADGTTPASLADITAAMATSVQNALNFREGHTFAWADNSEKTAQSGMVVGDMGYQTDNDTFYIYNGSAWKIWAKQETSYTPTITNFTASSSTFVYSIAGGQVFVTGKATCSTTLPSTTSPTTITLPTGYNINTSPLGVSEAATIGQGGVDDANTAAEYPIFVRVASSSTVQLVAPTYNGAATGTAYLTITSTTRTVPLTWESGDIFYINFSYPVA